MLGWFKKRGPSNTGPDYRHVDSREKAEDLYRRGELKKLLLLPVEFGGEDIPMNVVYVPPITVELKARVDLNTIKPLVQKRQVSRYTATPQYDGKSVIPILIRVSATDPGRFEGTIAIWGKGLEQGDKPIRDDAVVKQPAFAPAATTLEGLEPEAVVRAFIADYENWNKFAFAISEKDRTGAGMSASEAAYDTLVQKFCPPGHKPQPIACGSDSIHDVAREVVVSTEPGADSCVVKTRHTKTVGTLTIADDYEYHLRKSGQRWFLTSILYVDAKGKYEGL